MMNLYQSGWRKPKKIPTSDRSSSDALKDLDSVAKLAKQSGWADPKAFSLDMLDGPGVRHSAGEGGELNTGYTKFKDDIAVARGIDGSKRNQNRIETTWSDNPTVSAPTFWDGGEVTTLNPSVSGYKVRAGAIPGQKRHTSVWYQYDKDGKFQGANIDVEEKGLEGAAPLVGILTAAIGGGLFGGFSGIGNAAASSIGQTLSPLAAKAAGGAIVGGVGAGITGQNPIKGAALGGLGAGVEAMNPGGMMGLSGNSAMAVNKIANIGAKSAITGKAPNAFGTLATIAGGWK